MKSKKLPVGIENFEEIRKEGFYYVDKTGLIRDLLDNWGEVNLFTRPRRFGKTLNMSMLKSFFEIGADGALFEGLAISKETALCEAYMGKYAVISISFRCVDGLTFKQAYARLSSAIRIEISRFSYLLESKKLSDYEKRSFERLSKELDFSVNLVNSLWTLTRLLSVHTGKRVILLIDEYDTPLNMAYERGYYDEMMDVIRGLYGQALKTNDYLYFAVLTGCLPISSVNHPIPELNNFLMLSIADARYDQYFGFTDADVRRMLGDYGFSDRFDLTRDWYGGYRFGNADVYCPWNVVNYVDDIRADPEASPQAFWIHTSGNDLLTRFVNEADRMTQCQIERLIAGETVAQEDRTGLTHNEIYDDINSMWSALYMTGYLSGEENPLQRVLQLRIPNREVREAFLFQIQNRFKETTVSDPELTHPFYQALLNEDAVEAEKRLMRILGLTIIGLEAKAGGDLQERYYYNLLATLLRGKPDWLILYDSKSTDISIEPEDPDAGIVIEVKYAASIAGLGEASERAMAQIKERRYDERLRSDGRENILAYGIAFCKKRCSVVCEKLDEA